MGALERVMQRLSTGVPRVLSALQLATDVTASLPLLRYAHLALSGRGVEACDASLELGGGEWLWLSGKCCPGEIFRKFRNKQDTLEDQQLIFYIHGGAFVLCNPATHRAMTCNMAHATDSLVLSVDYRRAPEHRFPAALDDVLDSWRAVVSFFPPKRILVAGESAGGNLAVGLCLKLKALGLPLPGGLILISPWLDLSENPGSNSLESKDYLVPDLVMSFSRAYVDAEDSQQELASPFYSNDLGCLPRTLLIYGGAEYLAPQCARFASRLQEASVPYEVYVGPGMVHAFPVYGEVAYGRIGYAVVLAMGIVSAGLVFAFGALYAAGLAAACNFPQGAGSAMFSACAGASVVAVAVAWLRYRGKVLNVEEEWYSSSSSEDREGFEEETEPPPFEAFKRIGLFAKRLWDSEDMA